MTQPTAISQFMVDMRDSDQLVGVKEYALRDIKQQLEYFESLAKLLQKKNTHLQARVEYLEQRTQIEEIDCYV